MNLRIHHFIYSNLTMNVSKQIATKVTLELRKYIDAACTFAAAKTIAPEGKQD